MIDSILIEYTGDIILQPKGFRRLVDWFCGRNYFYYIMTSQFSKKYLEYEELRRKQLKPRNVPMLCL